MIEFADKKILATTLSNIVLLILDFCKVKLINDQSYSDGWKCQPFLLPGFDEVNFPFILLSG